MHYDLGFFNRESGARAMRQESARDTAVPHVSELTETPVSRMAPKKLVPAEGFEPPTYGLQNRCTTTVLSRQTRMEAVGG